MNTTNDKLKTIIIVALFSALIVVASKIEIRISDFRFHLGNALCLLSAFILSPFYAGTASGIGSMLFDLLFYGNGLGCIITFVSKFAMGLTASISFHKFNKILKNENALLLISGTLGEITYIILYLIKTFIERRYIMSMALDVVVPILFVKLSASVINAIVAIIASTLLYHITKKLPIT